MSNPHLPPEILDHIVDLLHDYPNALKACCLISKSWIPRTRKHLFAEVGLPTEERLQSWKKAFSDPSTSPACFTKSLRIGCPHVISAADAEAGGWLRDFAHIVHLDVGIQDMDKPVVSLAPFHGLSRTVKSLRLGPLLPPPSWILNFIISFPLLEDLIVCNRRTLVDDGYGSDDPSTFDQPSSSPIFTGFLGLFLHGGWKPIAGRLLSLPNGIHFRKLELRWCFAEDIPLISALVGGCSHTLESLDIARDFYGTSIRYLRLHR